jgi:hypothetical protein
MAVLDASLENLAFDNEIPVFRVVDGLSFAEKC